MYFACQNNFAIIDKQVEDIVDTGRTLQSLVSSLQEQGAASVKIATLLNKQARRVVNVQADYVGFEVSLTQRVLAPAVLSVRCSKAVYHAVRCPAMQPPGRDIGC